MENNKIKTYYRLEIAGMGSFFRSIDSVFNKYLKNGEVKKKWYSNNTEREEVENAIEDIEIGLGVFNKNLKIPPRVILGLPNSRSAFTQAGYNKFKEQIESITSALKYLGYKVNVIKINTNPSLALIWKDRFQVVYVNYSDYQHYE